MDTATIDKKGIAPLKEELGRINGMAAQEDVEAELIRLHRAGIMVLYSFGAQPDGKDSTRTIAVLGQGGLSLPDRDYYLKTDPKSVETRERFVRTSATCSSLPEIPQQDAAAKAKMVMDLETGLARISADRVTMRDPNKRYHIMTVAELKQLAPRGIGTCTSKALTRRRSIR